METLKCYCGGLEGKIDRLGCAEAQVCQGAQVRRKEVPEGVVGPFRIGVDEPVRAGSRRFVFVVNSEDEADGSSQNPTFLLSYKVADDGVDIGDSGRWFLDVAFADDPSYEVFVVAGSGLADESGDEGLYDHSPPEGDVRKSHVHVHVLFGHARTMPVRRIEARECAPTLSQS